MQKNYITGGGDVWYARPQLFFKCTLCPTGEMEIHRRHKEYSLLFFQHIWTHQPSAWQLHGEEGCSHAVRTISDSTADTLRMSSGKCAGSRAIDSVLLEWQHKQYHTAQVQGSYTCRSSCRFKTGQWNKKSSFLGQHLDVALRANISTRDHSSRLCRIAQKATCRVGEQDTCSSNHEAQVWGTTNCQSREQWLIVQVMQV